MIVKKIANNENFDRRIQINWLLSNNLPLDCLPEPFISYPKLDEDMFVQNNNIEFIEDKIKLGTINLIDG